ncbi:sulfotransferase family protein [Psychroserpens sp. Hel_I_66]|uniref:sulfotransferase family protein n=1 Tax=Psychroserpens sp. Hel_I_66 TaxID=1250004 RepID=UPI0009DE3008|nr:sulfotransferase [Psychroserpens sp. Hel_I_66]
MKSPIFIFSMPRAGSTLLQRILLSHKSIGGTAEPWLLLPLIYMKKNQGVISEYSSRLSHKAINDMLEETSCSDEFFYKQVRVFANGFYGKSLKDEEIFFLDKTPRYYFIIDEIYEVYPNAKFIFLFRNPTHIYASILSTWCQNNFLKLYGSHNDLTEGFNKISQAYLKHKNKKNTIGIKYEDLVSNPDKLIKELQEFLELEYDEKLKDNFIHSKIDTENIKNLGDPTGVKMYKSISKDTLHKWEKVFNTRFRKRILKRYINNNITNSNLVAQGYDKSRILNEIDMLNNKGKFNPLKDMLQYLGYKCIIRFNLYNYKSKDMDWTKKRFMS